MPEDARPNIGRLQSPQKNSEVWKGTITMGINFSNETDCTVSAYSDSDFSGCKETRRSTGGYCTYLGNNLISWSSKKQPTVSKSSTEAEYRSLSETASEITWIASALKELGVPLPDTPVLYCDNLSAIYLTANPAFHSRTKHFERDHHYVRERVALGTLVVKHVPSWYQIADIFTKPLPYAPFCELRFKLGVAEPPTPSLRGAIKAKPPLQSDMSQHSKSSSVSDQNGTASVTRQMGFGGNKPKPAKTETSESLSASNAEALQRSSIRKDKQRVRSTEFRIQTQNRFDSLAAETV